MTRILLDQNVPVSLGQLLTEPAATAHEMGWGRLSNGDLLAQAESAGFQVLITADQNIRYQQNLAERKIALIVLGTNRWRTVREHAADLNRAVANAEPGTYQHITFTAE
jgi:hypothetical protein